MSEPNRQSRREQVRSWWRRQNGFAIATSWLNALQYGFGSVFAFCELFAFWGLAPIWPAFIVAGIFITLGVQALYGYSTKRTLKTPAGDLTHEQHERETLRKRKLAFSLGLYTTTLLCFIFPPFIPVVIWGSLALMGVGLWHTLRNSKQGTSKTKKSGAYISSYITALGKAALPIAAVFKLAAVAGIAITVSWTTLPIVLLAASIAATTFYSQLTAITHDGFPKLFNTLARTRAIPSKINQPKVKLARRVAWGLSGIQGLGQAALGFFAVKSALAWFSTGLMYAFLLPGLIAAATMFATTLFYGHKFVEFVEAKIMKAREPIPLQGQTRPQEDVARYPKLARMSLTIGALAAIVAFASVGVGGGLGLAIISTVAGIATFASGKFLYNNTKEYHQLERASAIFRMSLMATALIATPLLCLSLSPLGLLIIPTVFAASALMLSTVPDHKLSKLNNDHSVFMSVLSTVLKNSLILASVIGLGLIPILGSAAVLWGIAVPLAVICTLVQAVQNTEKMVHKFEFKPPKETAVAKSDPAVLPKSAYQRSPFPISSARRSPLAARRPGAEPVPVVRRPSSPALRHGAE